MVVIVVFTHTCLLICCHWVMPWISLQIMSRITGKDLRLLSGRATITTSNVPLDVAFPNNEGKKQ